MVTSIAQSLGIGSGLDSAQIVKDLTAAARAPKETALATRQALNTARVSALGTAANGIDAFATALSNLISSGSLFTQPVPSDASIVAAAAVPGSAIGNLSAQIEVKGLAAAQVLSSAAFASATAPIGQGKLEITSSLGPFEVEIGPGDDSLNGLAKAINKAGSGVSASVVRDTSGYRLVLKGSTGAIESFTVDMTSGNAGELDRFTFDGAAGTMTRSQTARDAEIVVDGVTYLRAGNSVGDLIPGVTLSLKKAAPGTIVSLEAQRPTEAIKLAISDFAAAYNELKATLDAATAAGKDGGASGPLRGNAAIRDMQRAMARLTSTKLIGDGADNATLAEIGVRTNRDGTLSVDTARLDAVLASDPGRVETLFNPGQRSSSPLIQITSGMGLTKPGTYVLKDVVKGPPPSGTVNGITLLPAGNRLIAPGTSAAAGLSFEPLGDVSGATITVDPGLGGALQAIRDKLRASGGPLAASQEQYAREASSIAKDRESMEKRSTAYETQLSRAFSSMDSRVAAIKATQSYLDQQIKVWTNSND